MRVGTALASLLLVAVVGAQEASKLDRLLDAARNGSPVVRPQAAQRLVGMADEAAPKVLALLETTSLAGLGRELVEVVPQLGDADLRDRTWSAVADADFPWRPAAARGLAATIQASELSRAAAWLGDPLSPVRSAAVAALGRLGAKSHKDRLRAILFTDANDRVRRDAALLFDSWGERWALAWIVEELDRTDEFFDQPTGRAARFAAVRALETALGHPIGIEPRHPASAAENADSYATLRDEVKRLAGGRWPKLPDVAKVAAEVPPAVVGFDVRSCRAGEHFLRFSADDRLWIGDGANPASTQLPAGSVELLVARVRESLGALEPGVWGEPGCDAEQLYLADGDATRLWRVSKGAEPVAGLRPEALGRAFAQLLQAFPENADSARGELERALAAVGGALEPAR